MPEQIAQGLEVKAGFPHKFGTLCELEHGAHPYPRLLCNVIWPDGRR